MNAEKLIDLLKYHYRVKTITELATKINVGQPAISKWKNDNSYKLVLKKCKELGIYKDIHKMYTSSMDEFQEIVFNSVRYRILIKVLTEVNGFQNELLILINSIKDTEQIYNREELEELIKRYNINEIKLKELQVTTNKHRNNLISLIYTFDDMEINYICNNLLEFKEFIYEKIQKLPN